MNAPAASLTDTATAAYSDGLDMIVAVDGSRHPVTRLEPVFNTFMPDPRFLSLGSHGHSGDGFDLLDRQTRGKIVWHYQFVDRADGIANQGNIAVGNDWQTYGYGRRTIGGLLLGMQELGYREYQIYASLSAGGYAWAKTGFPFDTDPNDSDRVPLTRTLSARLNILQDLVPQLQWSQLQDSIALDDPHCLHRLVQFRPDIDLRDHLDDGVFADDSEVMRHFRRDDAKFMHGMDPLREAWVKAAPGRITPGYMLLAGSKWPGKLAIDDADPDFRAVLDYAAAAPPLPSELEINERLIALRNKAEAKLG